MDCVLSAGNDPSPHIKTSNELRQDQMFTAVVSPPPGWPAAPSPEPQAPSPPNPNGVARQLPSVRRRPVYVAAAAAGLLLTLLAWALVAGIGAGERRVADRHAGQSS